MIDELFDFWLVKYSNLIIVCLKENVTFVLVKAYFGCNVIIISTKLRMQQICVFEETNF